MFYNGNNYFDDNEGSYLDVYLTEGDQERLYYIASKYNIPYTNFDPGHVIRYIIREYYKEHDILKFILKTRGYEYKEYNDFLAEIRKLNGPRDRKT